MSANASGQMPNMAAERIAPGDGPAGPPRSPGGAKRRAAAAPDAQPSMTDDPDGGITVPVPHSPLIPEQAEDGHPAKKIASPERAASPAKPTREMSLLELTHGFQSLAAQGEIDRKWMLQVEEAITDHATRIEQHAKCFWSEMPARLDRS